LLVISMEFSQRWRDIAAILQIAKMDPDFVKWRLTAAVPA
jgi:hypothetical protein